MDNIYTKIRKRYGLSRVGMSKILGFGVNQWRKYEEGIVEPKDSHALLIGMIRDPRSFERMMTNVESVLIEDMGKRRYGKLRKRVMDLVKLGDGKVEEHYKVWIDTLYNE